jgi:multiple sugar transport system substrate-binding protein
MFVRTDITKKLGISSQPKTVQELKDVCIRITNASANQFGFAIRGKNQVSAFFDPFVFCNVPNIDPNNIYRLSDGQVSFTHPAVLQGLKDWVDLYERGAPPDSINWGWNEQIQGFSSGITPYLYQDPDTIPLLAEMQLTTDQYATFPMPVGSTGKVYLNMGPGGPGIPSYSKNKEAAWKFIAFSLTPERNAKMNKVYGALPVHSVSYEKDPYFGEGVYKAYATQFSDPARYPVVQYPWDSPKSPGWRQIHDADMQAVLLHKMSPEDAVAKWAAYWK